MYHDHALFIQPTVGNRGFDHRIFAADIVGNHGQFRVLLVHTLVGNARDNPQGPWAELAAVALALGLQWWKRHALLNILLATALYVALRNT